MKVDRLVIDTNVLISAALSSAGAPANLLDHLQIARTALVFSEPTMAELATNLLRTKFDRYVDHDTRIRFLAEIDAVAEFVGISGAPMGCRDRSDDMFLETALTAECQLIISGDQDLLTLDPWRNIRILSPEEALKTIF
ncbi:MAG: putative toxin-antitoxin system toxin component, PIN family [Pseudomonadales bacterium]